MTFLTLIGCKNCIVCLKRPENIRKRGRGWPIKKTILILAEIEYRQKEGKSSSMPLLNGSSFRGRFVVL